MKILITGASSGIGRACVEKCLKKGYSVVGISRSIDASSFNHPQFFPSPLDLTKLQSIEKHFKNLLVEHPDITGAIFSAGAPLFGYLEQLSSQSIEQLINLNFTSHAICAKSLLPSLKKRGSGTLIFVGSEAALAGKSQGSIYCASKFALRGFCQALRKECSKRGVRISLINPGMVDTPFFDTLHFRPQVGEDYACSADDVADCIIKQLEAKPHFVIDEINLSPLKHHLASTPLSSKKDNDDMALDKPVC